LFAFSFIVWNGASMPRREVVFTGLFAFGAGVAVGANWPKASNIVGYILNRLGFELADLAVWMWDPEKTAILNQENQPALLARSKKKAKVLRKGSRKSPLKKTTGKSKKNAPARQKAREIIAPLTVRKGLKVAVVKSKGPQTGELKRRPARAGLTAAKLSSDRSAASRSDHSQTKKTASKSSQKVSINQSAGKRTSSSARLAGAALN
jgi:hypothetical protein